MSKRAESGEQLHPGFRRDLTLFLIYFFLIWAVLFALTRMMPGIGKWMERLVSRELALTLRALNLEFNVRGNLFNLNTGQGMERLHIIAECTGIFTTMIYIAIIGAFPADNRSKVLGLLIGVPSIHILNYLRVAFIAVILYEKRELFGLFHGYLWQISFVGFMLLLVFFWMSRIAVFKSSSTEGKS
ncbi:MAG: archaeosortase/exosortase family protein [Candidatus Krumholzibacteriales bacterium]